MTENILIPNLQTSAITYSNQADKIEASSQIVTPLIIPVNSHVQDVSTLSSRRAFVIKESQDGPFKGILSPNCGQIMDIEQSKDLRIFLNLFPQSSNIFKSKLSKKHLVQPICIN